MKEKIKKVIILTIISILLIGISLSFYKFYQVKQELRVVKSEQNESYFNKKTECEQYAESIKEEIDKGNKGIFAGSDFNSFQMLFYSPKEDSCLYVIQRLPDREHFIYNALTHHRITSFRFPEQWEDYKKFLLEYSNGEIRL
ncbi:hypothetical protein KKE19_02465 [Patescibacteria group bacterium]|nr:hypothetical protein [Patescibacteria group bacterium]MBU4367699.1 hypothetical protein [Patescibacteria group bacterium]MBU4461851.1 hypothetical protein [Patescibacteria group bacterium]MCG2700018.1 hypothetical protein [Candidatus Parcubacteria bacterium]